MELSSFMSAQVAQLQQTVQMSMLNKTLNMGTASVIQMLDQLPNQQTAPHPHKGTTIDVSI